MKKLLLFIFLLTTSVTFAQTSICGVNFGSSYSAAERILENKFGDKSVLISDKTSIGFMKKMYAGRIWDMLLFNFQSDGHQSYLNRCTLVYNCDDLKEAMHIRDAIKEQMDKKYIIIDFTDKETNLIYYLGGESPTDKDMPGFSISIIKYNDDLDEKKYGVRVDYGPYNYVKEEL